VKRNPINALVLVVVIVVVAGVAWFRASRSARPAAEGPAPAESDSAVAQPAALPVQQGTLCAEPPPAATTKTEPTSAPASQPSTTQAVAGKLPRVVDLGADKCIPCKKLAPILEELKKDYAGRVHVEFIDVWKNPRAGEPYKIRVIPTQVFFDADGKEVWRHEGFLPKADFIAKFADLGVK
jgi:thioredoxin 1